jgi:mRNA-degrading endonuclease RelE of RelBE toxin-antitoxin system
MNARRIYLAPGFGSALRKLEPDVQELVKEAVRKFRDRSAESSLQPEKKSGLKGIWAFRVNLAIRVFYVQRRDKTGTYNELFHVGSHDDYRTVINKKPKMGRSQTH